MENDIVSLNINILIDGFKEPIPLTFDKIAWNEENKKKIASFSSLTKPFFTSKFPYQNLTLENVCDRDELDKINGQVNYNKYALDIKTTDTNMLTTLSLLFPDFYENENKERIFSSHDDFVNTLTGRRMLRVPPSKPLTPYLSYQLLQVEGKYFLPVQICWLNDIRCHPLYKSLFDSMMELMQWYNESAEDAIFLKIQKALYSISSNGRMVNTINDLIVATNAYKPGIYGSSSATAAITANPLKPLDMEANITEVIVELKTNYTKTQDFKKYEYYDEIEPKDLNLNTVIGNYLENQNSFCSLAQIKELADKTVAATFPKLEKFINTYKTLYDKEKLLLGINGSLKKEIVSILNQDFRGKEDANNLPEAKDLLLEMKSTKINNLESIVKSINELMPAIDKLLLSANDRDPIIKTLNKLQESLQNERFRTLSVLKQCLDIVREKKIIFNEVSTDEDKKKNYAVELLKDFAPYKKFLDKLMLFRQQIVESSNPALNTVVKNFTSNENTYLNELAKFINTKYYNQQIPLNEKEKKQIKTIQSELKQNETSRQLFYVGFTRNEKEIESKEMSMYLSMRVIEIPKDKISDKAWIKTVSCPIKNELLGTDFTELVKRFFYGSKKKVNKLYTSEQIKYTIKGDKPVIEEDEKEKVVEAENREEGNPEEGKVQGNKQQEDGDDIKMKNNPLAKKVLGGDKTKKRKTRDKKTKKIQTKKTKKTKKKGKRSRQTRSRKTKLI